MVTCCPDTLSTVPVAECIRALLSEGAVAFPFSLLVSAAPQAVTLTASVARLVFNNMFIRMLSCLTDLCCKPARERSA